MDYSRLLTHAFKRFSVLSATRTGLPTAWEYMHPYRMPTSEKPALFTMNILPQMMTVWYHCAKKALGDRADIVIFDCSGWLRPEDFPGARVQKFINPRHAQKCDRFLHSISRNRSTAWVCDDDTFLLSGETLDIVERELAIPNTAAISFEPRNWWHFEIDGKEYPPLGTYCLGLNRRIVSEKEHLSFAPDNGNEHPSHIEGRPVRRYDSFDKANETLLQKGYRCAIVENSITKRVTAGFDGLSNAVMLLHYFKTPEQTISYFEGPEDKQWKGNILFRAFQGMLAISTIRELAERISGQPCVIRSLPNPATLNRIRQQKGPLLRSEHSFDLVDETSERLRRFI